jgi:hypothetical protein
VRAFFNTRRETPAGDRTVWTPDDPSIRSYAAHSASGDWKSAETINDSWEAVERWFLSCEPAPPPEHAAAIRNWIRAIDELPRPSRELRAWILSLERPQRPPREFRQLILRARQTLPISWRLAADQVRLSASCILAAALFTLFGMLSPSIRRPLARSFVLVMMFLTGSLMLSSLGPPGWNLTFGVVIGGLILGGAMVLTAVRVVPNLNTGRVLWAVLAVWWISIIVQASIASHETGSVVGRTSMIVATSLLAILGVVNAHYWLIGPREDPPQDDAGIAQRRPPQLWTLWLVQFAIVLAVGVSTLVSPEWTAELFTNDDYDDLTTDVVDDSVRMLGAWMIALALFSYFSLGVAQDWIWQGIGWMFCTVFAVLALSTLFNALSGGYSIWGFAFGFQGVVFVPVTLLMLLRRDPWSTVNVERIRRHWSLADLAVAVPLIWAPLRHGRRAVYRHGVAARGRLRVLPAADGVPDSVSFVPGADFPVEARFANRTQEDDAALDVRGCALRLPRDAAGPLDLLFATGAFAPANCLMDFLRLLCPFGLRRGILAHKVLREGLAAGMRRAPRSFAGLSYYHPLVLEWLTPAAGYYLVRFRLVPISRRALAPGSGETITEPGANARRLIDPTAHGLPDEEDLRHLWQQERRAGETRDRDYLRRELRDRLSGQTVSFQLEAQFHLPCRGDSLDWYDPSLEWDERTHPWRPIAEECEALRFDPARLPTALRVPMPDSETDVYDPRSLAASMFRVAGALGRLRTWRSPPPAARAQVIQPATTDDPEQPVAAESHR